jgi:hypothetical protein
MKYTILFAFVCLFGTKVFANQYIMGVTVGRFPTASYGQQPLPAQTYNVQQPVYVQNQPNQYYQNYQRQNNCMNYCCECYSAPQPVNLPYRQIRIQEITEPALPY